MGRPEPKCPIRPGDTCSLCFPGADGPHNCGLVWLVMDDDAQRDELHEITVAARAQRRAQGTAPRP
jgi:hypothetical protein